jgi:hypothetical protein
MILICYVKSNVLVFQNTENLDFVDALQFCNGLIFAADLILEIVNIGKVSLDRHGPHMNRSCRLLK